MDVTPKQEARAKAIIDQQVSMSGQTLDKLRDAGLTDTTLVQLDFFFDAPSERAARALVEQLEKNDCLDVSATKAGGIFSSKYSVSGKTHETTVTPVVLGQWIPWIVVQGMIHDCDFDGWGTVV